VSSLHGVPCATHAALDRKEKKGIDMRIGSRLIATAVLSVLFVPLTDAAPPAEETMQIKEQNDNFVLTLPVRKLSMLMPKGGLSISKDMNGGSDNRLFLRLASRRHTRLAFYSRRRNFVKP
jgi:hypothetical protein